MQILKTMKIVTFENLQHYHNSLMKYLNSGKLIPTNICPQCGGIVDENNKCNYCGVKLKLVIDKGA